MNSSAITFVINGATYRLGAGDISAIRNIPEADRAELVALLEAVQAQDVASKAAVQAAAARATISISSSVGSSGQPLPKAERLGSGDVDALMAKLIMEEKRERKPGLTKQGIYKVVGFFVVVILLFAVIG
ncbi:MAG: hypothetical protein AB8B81_21015 [Halioglobus sp.]